jgi:hypothetical protein
MLRVVPHQNSSRKGRLKKADQKCRSKMVVLTGTGKRDFEAHCAGVTCVGAQSFAKKVGEKPEAF